MKKNVLLLTGLLALVLTHAIGAPVQTAAFVQDKPATPLTDIDRAVFAQLDMLGIPPAQPCSDAVFIRRVYLDVIGTLPTPYETRNFLLDTQPGKRAALIDKLLDRDEFADYWAMKWCDLLRVKAEFPINLWPNGVHTYYRWIHTSIKANKPYDQFARELLTASGSNFRVAPVNFYRAAQSADPEILMQSAALTFMGVRINEWPAEKSAGLRPCFSYVGFKKTAEWKEEVVFFDSVKAAEDAMNDSLPEIVFPDGTVQKIDPEVDPRTQFADWLITPQNLWFTRNMANRCWYWLQGRGIVNEPDDMRADNPAQNPQLLKLLGQQLVDSGYDLKALFRSILNSQTYQLSSIPASQHPKAEACFAHYPVRRLDAEVLIDALCQITGTTEKYESAIPEPFTFIPEDQRSIALADGSITSSFLELFGRPPRDTGQVLERNNRSTAAQRLHFLNSTHVQKKVEQSKKLKSLAQAKTEPKQKVDSIYLAILSRYPTPAEYQVVQSYAKEKEPNSRNSMIDLSWALINTAEFLYRH